ncbi:MAG: AbrB/MazE/SpoVT family DNA-binding domain-containing protein [Oscillospiraceae bacterium]|jgi:AbrB family looped-hinge helix DNA binding protein|nr:AbrB/MazE/SpoVT family DNA-binding domain-containing protein [Oscillospiraceae bacterium]
MFDVSFVSAKGQVTIPAEMRRQLGVKEGDKVVFINNGKQIIIENAAMAAIRELQEAFTGEAERLGLKDEADVAAMMKEIRREMWEERRGDYA